MRRLRQGLQVLRWLLIRWPFPFALQHLDVESSSVPSIAAPYFCLSAKSTETWKSIDYIQYLKSAWSTRRGTMGR